MGCSASVTPASTIPSCTKVDVATNTVSDEALRSLLPAINAAKYFNETSTQTDSLQDDLEMNQTSCSEGLNNGRLNIVSDNQNGLEQRTNSSEIAIRTYNATNPRFHQNPLDREELDWILFDLDANQFCVNNQSLLMSASQVTPAVVVDAIEKSDDFRNVTPEVWKLLNKAKGTGDATYLVQAYTVESHFYKILNRKLARQSLSNPMSMDIVAQMQATLSAAFGQMNQFVSAIQAFQADGRIGLPNNNETDWARLFLQAMYRLIMIPNSTLRYQGLTYRGMRLTQKELECYNEDRIFVCNKAITSTSKLRSVAEGFFGSAPRPEHMVDVLFIYNIDSYSALFAIDVHTISSIPPEEEVLIMPGILLTIGETKVISPHSREIELRSAYKDLAEGMMANSLTGLLSNFESESSSESEYKLQ
ncbi:unnamed protein product [Adineta steineri]|uniref:Mono(ADP-ribosyl)transferase n=1 Tax=Adineta steineri TaxID=433720 RepID=A0A814HLB1_9BILA|nr:unnamed protein product [Adineta steineri]CAF1669603.1 unnamed protein product [Adineta steineri]